VPPLFDSRQALQDESDYDALSSKLPAGSREGGLAVVMGGTGGATAGIPAGTSGTPVSEWDRHGEQVNQEPENREGFDARLAPHPLAGYNESVYTLRRSRSKSAAS